MDRVLLLFDDIQYASHVEKTLRKLGFDTETISNEYNLNEKILTFNPDFIVVKGEETSRASSLLVGMRLKQSIKFGGKVILIFPEDSKPSGDDLIKLRMDLLLSEPLSAMRLCAHILSFAGGNHDSIMDKLIRMAQTDMNFRHNEQQILRVMGESVDTEIQLISEKLLAESKSIVIDDNIIQSFIDPQFRSPVQKKSVPAVEIKDKKNEVGPAAVSINPEFLKSLQVELKKTSDELPLRIETYNQAIKGIDQDLSIGINKRHTKKQAVELLDVTSPTEKKGRDEERKQFVTSLFKKM